MLIAAAYRTGLRVPKPAACALVLMAVAVLVWSAQWEHSVAWRVLVWGGPGAALVAAATCVEPGAAATRSGLMRCLVFLGDASYSLYLVHLVVFSVLRRSLAGFSGLPGWAFAYALALIAVSFAAALATYWLFERPVTRALYRSIARRQACRAARTAA
jgi:peptidoglycan/LPS O-acetylase OafA/YrhL